MDQKLARRVLQIASIKRELRWAKARVGLNCTAAFLNLFVAGLQGRQGHWLYASFEVVLSSLMFYFLYGELKRIEKLQGRIKSLGKVDAT